MATATARYEPNCDEPLFCMKAKVRSLVSINILAIIVGSIVVLVLLLVRMLFHPVLFVFIIVVLVAYMVVDYLVWNHRGIRRIEVYDDRIIVYRGKAEEGECIPGTAITDIDVFSKLNRHVVNVITGGTVDKPLPGVTLFSGSRVRITDDAFEREEFKQFVVFLQKIKKKRDERT